MRALTALEDGTGVDFAGIRRDRRRRVADAMVAADVDVLLLGRQGNCRYVAGHRPIWRAVVTAWGPFVGVVRAADDDVAVHLMHTTWDDGVPAEIPHERITGLTWNPRNVVANIAALPGLASAQRIGVDGMSLGMAKLLAHVAPSADLTDGEALLRACRAIKLPAEVECIRTAVAVTEGALAAVLAAAPADREALAPGVREAELRGRFCEELGRFGVNHPAMEGVVAATSPTEPGPRFLPAPGEDRVLADGDLVALQVAAPWGGYEGSVGRTWPVGDGPSGPQRAVWARWSAAASAVVAACRPGATAGDLEAAWTSTGEALPPVPIAHGVGIGVEQPVVPGAGGAVLEAGMVLAVQGTVTASDAGTVLGQEVVLVNDDRPEVLTRLSHGPLEYA